MSDRPFDGSVFDEESLFRSVAHASPVGIFISSNFTLRYVNPALAALLGRAPEELVGADPIAVIHPDDREEVLRRRGGQAALPMFSERREIRLLKPDGAVAWIDLTVASFVFNGTPAFVGIGIDITERKELERQVRTADRLATVGRLEAVGRLAGGVAHDFNNLLMVVSGQSERLLEGLRPEDPLYGVAESIKEATARAAELTEQLLIFGRRQMLVPRVLDLSALVAGLQGALREAIGPGVNLRTDLAAGLPSAHVDQRRFERVLLDLAINGAEAMSGEGTLTITTDVLETDDGFLSQYPFVGRGRYVRVQVGDTGRGIPAESLPFIFEPFFTTKTENRRAGLGLSSAYGTVKQSNGFVFIDSQPGQGARVTILLPSTTQAVIDDVRPAPAGPVVLLVEDEAAVRRLVGEMLRRHGFIVREAEDAEMALRVADEGPVDVLVSDVLLPAMNGVDLARALKERWPSLRVLLMSGYAANEVLESPFRDDRSFIKKPFSRKDLISRITGLMDDRV